MATKNGFVDEMNKHGGSRPVKREDDGRLKTTMQFKRHVLILDCTDEEVELIRRVYGTRRRAEILLMK